MEALLLDPLGDTAEEVAAEVARLPRLGAGWWDRYPVGAGTVEDDQARKQLLAAMTDGEVAV